MTHCAESGLRFVVSSTLQTTRFGAYLILQILVTVSLTELSSCQLEEQPRFLDMNLNYTYNRGDLATLYCRVENLGTRFVIWRRTSQPNPISVGTDIFAPDDRYHIQRIQYRGSWNLLIKNVSLKDAGVYECQISAKERAGSRRLVLLRVLDHQLPEKTPTQDIIVSGSPYVEIGNSLKLMCNASTDDFPTEDVDWFKDGEKLYHNERTSFSNYVSFDDKVIVSSLTISDTRLEDAGTYVCRVSDVQINSTKILVLGSVRSQNTKRDMTATGALGTDKTNASQKTYCNIFANVFIILTNFIFHRIT